MASSVLELPARLRNSLSVGSIESPADKGLQFEIEPEEEASVESAFLDSGSNWLAVNAIGELELGVAGRVKLEKRQRPTIASSDRWKADNNKWSANATRRDGKTLLDFSSKDKSFVLPLENELNLNSARSNSLMLDNLLVSPNLSGSLQDNLE